MNGTDWMQLIAHWVVSAAALGVTAALVPGFRVNGFSTCLIGALVIGFANAWIKPFLVFLTFPLTIITLGLFLWVVDAIILRVSAALLKNMEITNWFSAILGGVILAITSSLLHWMFI